MSSQLGFCNINDQGSSFYFVFIFLLVSQHVGNRKFVFVKIISELLNVFGLHPDYPFLIPFLTLIENVMTTRKDVKGISQECRTRQPLC